LKIMTNEFDSKAKTWDMDADKILRSQKVGDAILNEIRDITPCKAFEYGCGTGLLGLYMHLSFSRLICADTSSGMLDVLKSKISQENIKNVFPVELDLTEDEVPDENYKVIFSMLTLHHVMNIDKILASFHQLLESGGMFFIADLDKEDGSFHGEGFIGHNGFDREDLKAKVFKAGFKNIRFQTITEIVKEVSKGEKKAFPLFLMTAEK